MKQKPFVLLTVVTICLITFSAYRHRPFNYQVLTCYNPENGASGELLEQMTATPQKAKGQIKDPTYAIPGTKSQVRCKLNQICFEITSTAGESNPNQSFSLYKLTGNKTSRTLTMITDVTNNTTGILLQIAASEAGKYKVFPVGPMTVGEYAFLDKSTTQSNGNVTVWTFGIDQ